MITKHKNNIGSLMVLLTILLMSSCQDSILVGNELLENEKINLAFTDSLGISSKTIDGDRITTYTVGVDSRTYLAGKIEDPTYGTSEASIYFKTNLVAATPPNYNLETGTVKFDSLILVLSYDTLGTYPNSNNSLHKVELFQLSETYASTDTFYSDTNLNIGDLLAEGTILVNTTDSVSIIDHVTGDTIQSVPQMRLKLNANFGKTLLSDAEAATSDTAYVNLTKGFYLKSTPLSGSSIYGFNFSIEALASANKSNRLIMYYTVDDTIKKEYQYLINTATINAFNNTIAGTTVENVINTTTMGNETTYLQGMAGVKTVVSFDDLAFLDDKLINKVELDVFVSEPIGINEYEPPYQLIATHISSTTGKLVFINDISQLLNSGLTSSSIFGSGSVFKGYLDETAAVRKYTLNITNHIKEVLSDPTYNSEITIGILNESETPRRVALFGAKHSTYPMKLKVSYTNQ
jgi:hypothetical protein